MRRLTRILLWTAGAVLTLVLVTAVLTETTFFKQWLRGIIVRQANQHLNGTLSIGRLSGNLYSGFELDDVAVAMDGRTVVSIDAVNVSYRIRELLSGGVTVDRVSFAHPVVAVRREGDGWQLGRLVRKDASEANRRGPSRPIAVRHIAIADGSFTVEKPQGEPAVNVPRTFGRFNAALSFAYAPVHYTIEIGSMSFVASDPDLALREVSGTIAVKDDRVSLKSLTVRTGETSLWIDGAMTYRQAPSLALQISLRPLSLPEVRRLVPAMKPMDVAPQIDLRLDGPMSRVATEFSVRSRAGDFSGRGTVGLGGPDRIFQGELAVHHLDLAPFLNNPEQKSDIVVYAKVDLRGPAGFDSLRGTVAADAPLVETHGYLVSGIRANARIDGRAIRFDTSEVAYKSHTTSAGSVVFADDKNPVTRFELRGVVKDVGVAYLPTQMRVPPAETKLTANYHVNILIPRGPGWHLDGDVALDQSTVAGVSIAPGATASFAFGPDLVQYRADMNVSNVDLKQIGEQFNITALASPRYKTSLNGHVNAAVTGATLETLDLSASGSLTDSSAFGGRFPEMAFESTFAHDSLHVRANGQIEKINPAAAAGQPSLDGSVTGNVDADLTFNHVSRGTDLDSVEGELTADLGPSTIGNASIDKASISGDYHKSFADIYQLEVSGSDVIATGHGTLAFNETDQSGFWIHAEASHLESVNAAVNSEHLLTGLGTVDAVVGGNRKEFTANGTATGDAIKYDDYGALAASTKFTAKVPDLDAQRASVTADSHATFVDVPGLQVNDLAVKTEYSGGRVAFDMTATQPKRTLIAAGSMLFQPDSREVRLQRLKFDTQGMSWQTDGVHEPVITYGDQAIGVKDFSLVSATGGQQIAADGAFGAPDQALTVTLKDVDLGVVDAWLMRPPQLSGTVNAKSVIRGTRDALHADTDFTIANGKFRDVAYQSLAGNAKYSPALLVLDTRLQQNASQWLTAKGSLPLSFIRGTKNADRLDFHIDSSAVDLGLIQGLTTAITGVKGTVQAKIDLTGTSEEPSITGGVAIQGGAFKLEDTGVAYSRLDGRVDLLPGRAHITDLHVLDRDNQSLSLTGDLGVSGFQVSAVNLGVYADRFQVLANEMGNVRVNTNLELTGTVAHPKIGGDLEIATGSINLDPILARFQNSAYSTTARDQAKAEEARDSSRQGVFGSPEVAIHVTIPDDLVVKGSDLKTSSDALVGLGSVNITLGGDLNVTARPNQPVTLVGSVNTIRGFYDFQGRRFNILRDGKVRFEGDAIDRLDPTLDVGAERVIQAVTVHVNVRGRLRRPNIELTSVPPQEQADLLALIVFNQPLNELGAGQQVSLAQRAGSMAAGAATGQLTESIANSLNLDQFEVNLSPDSGNTAELTVGQQFGQNLYVKVQQGIGDHSQTNVVLEYEFSKWLRLQTNVLEGSNTQQQLFQRVQSTGLDLVFSFAFK